MSAGRKARSKQRPWVLRARHWAEYLFVRLLCCFVGMLSARQTKWLAELIAGVLDRLPGRLTHANIAFDNLRTAFPHATDQWIHQTIHEMWVHLVRMVAEMIQFERKLTLDNCRDVVVFRNRRASVKAVCTGRNVLVLGGHFGSWEASMMTFGVFGYPMGVVARDLDNPFLHRWFEETRQKTGHRLYAKKGGYDGMTDLLQQGGSLALLCDQDAGPRGIFTEFFGKPASTFKSLALLAIEYDAVIVCGYGRRLQDDFENARWTRFEIGCDDVIDPRDADPADPVGDLTRRYTEALERAVRRAPEQYFWVHRRWKTAVGAKRKRRRAKLAAA